MPIPGVLDLTLTMQLTPRLLVKAFYFDSSEVICLSTACDEIGSQNAHRFQRVVVTSEWLHNLSHHRRLAEIISFFFLFLHFF